MDLNNNTDDGEKNPVEGKPKKNLPSAVSKDALEKFLEERKGDVAVINKSQYSSFKAPEYWYQKLLNILCSSRKRRLKDYQASAKGANGCEVIEKYRDWVSKDLPLPEIVSELNRAVNNTGQLKITSFFSKQSRPNRPIEIETSTSSENENDAIEEDSTANGGGDHSDLPEEQRNLFKLFEVSSKGAGSILKEIKLDKEFLSSKKSVELIKSFHTQFRELETIKNYDRDSKLTDEKKKLLKMIADLKCEFKTLSELCDSENNSSKIQGMSMEETLVFLKKNSDDANKLARGVFLKLNSNDFQTSLKSVTLKIRKRISNIRNQTPSSSQPLSVVCHRASDTWDECLQSLEGEWVPGYKNSGGLKIEDFIQCHAIFRAMEFRGDHFVTVDNLLKWLNMNEAEKRLQKQVIHGLVSNLPVLLIKKDQTEILMSVSAFLHSKEMMEDFIEIVQESSASADKEIDINIRPGKVPDKERVKGSGRPSIIDSNPEILESVEDYCSMAGVAAHDRRRDLCGRTGFTVGDVRDSIMKKLFSSNPEKCPSLATFRRIFEAPNKTHKTSSYYKSKILAVPGVKRNDETARGDGGHPHRHPCFSFFRKCREFAALHSDQFTVISADNKCKLPLGLPCVNRLNSLRHKFFLRDQGPNYTDHDHRTGYLVNPEGYQILDFTKAKSKYESDEDSITQRSGSSQTSDMSDEESITEKGDRQVNDKDDSDQGEIEAEIFLPVSVQNERSISTLVSCNLMEVQDEFMSEIPQTDGTLDSSSSEEEFDFDFAAHPVVMRPLLQDSQMCSDEVVNDDQSSESETEAQKSSDKEEKDDADQSSESEVETQEEDPPSSRRQVNIGDLIKAETVVDSNGREHIKIPNTGETYVFYKSHRAKPSTIARHMEDLCTIDLHNKFKKNLLLLCDDGADWAGRSVQTIYWLGWLWRNLNLDILILARNSPGDSKWNPIERFWSFINRKLAGVTLPTVQDGEDEDEAEDAAIKLLIDSALGELTYDGHKVHSVRVPCIGTSVCIEGEDISNEFISQEKADLVQKVMMDKKMTKRKLKETHPEISEDLNLFFKHVDNRLHAFVFRKCSPNEASSCKYCKENPPQSSQILWDTLPNKTSGGLFYDVGDDEELPGHFSTLLQDISKVEDIQIEPDNKFKNDHKFQRCKEVNCFCSFKSEEDGRRHMRLAHDAKYNPLTNVCKFLVEGVPCGESYETYWKLQQHKIKMSHKQTRTQGAAGRGGRGRGRKN